MVDAAAVIAAQRGDAVGSSCTPVLWTIPRLVAVMSKLWECAKAGDADAVGELLDAGADPNDPEQAQQPAGRSPLHLAAAGNFTDVVVLLLGAGADPNAQNSSQRTALHVAIACDAPDTAVYLLENGARMDVKDEWGSSPMECARNAAMRQTLLPYKVDATVLAAAPVPQPEPAPESERPAVPVDDLAAAQMRMLVVGEILAEEAETAAQSTSAADEPAAGSEPGAAEAAGAAGTAAAAAAAPVVAAPPVGATDEAAGDGGAEDPPPLEE